MKKELRRDPNNKIIAGVCSGIAKYLDIDPVIIRLIWAAAIFGSLSTVVGDEKLTSRENLIGFLFLYVQSDENTLPKVNKVSKTEA